MCLCAQIVKPFEGLQHECSGKVISEVVETHLHQFMLGESLRALESESSLPSNEICNLFVLHLFDFNQLWNPYLSLSVVALTEELLFHRLPTIDGCLKKVWIPSEGCPF